MSTARMFTLAITAVSVISAVVADKAAKKAKKYADMIKNEADDFDIDYDKYLRPNDEDKKPDNNEIDYSAGWKEVADDETSESASKSMGISHITRADDNSDIESIQEVLGKIEEFKKEAEALKAEIDKDIEDLENGDDDEPDWEAAAEEAKESDEE